jgi:egghead protein (zeste-white 4 protein)
LYLTILGGLLLPSVEEHINSLSLVEVAIACVILVSLAVHYSVSMAGLVLFGAPSPRNRANCRRLSEQGWDSSKRLIFCFVSQGVQERVLAQSVQQLLALVLESGLKFQVEVVVDSAELSDTFFSHPSITVIRVPDSYSTVRGAKFKARSLCYAAKERSRRERNLSKTWVVHCDEDTVITQESLAGIAEFLGRPASDRMCGAGEIKYNLDLPTARPLLSVVDYHRTGEDLGRYRLQFAGFGAALFGAHGSFTVVPAVIEEQIQFDHGPRGSIAEDIYFALRLRELGIPLVWIAGYVREQSPGNLRNFFQQRARWIRGLLNACFDSRFSLGNRIVLLAYLAMWRTSIIAGIALLAVLLTEPGASMVLALWGLDMASMATVVLVGTLRNFEEDQRGHPIAACVAGVGVLLLTPVVCLLETAAVAYALFAERDTFFVVEKSPIPAATIPSRALS